MLEIADILGNFGVTAALIAIGLLVFAECAFLLGLFVPGGDILLILVGVFVSQGDLPLAGVLIVVFVSAVAGFEVGYYIGKKSGPMVFTKKEGIFFRKEYADKASKFYDNHGGKTVIISRFIGYVRTVAPLLAGIGGMGRKKFVIYNIAGAFLWSVSMVMLGFWLGKAFADEVKLYSIPLSIAGIILVIGMSTYSLLKRRRQLKREATH